MNDTPLWLPPGCLTSRRAIKPIEKAVNEWASEWFHANPWQVLGTWDAVSTQAMGQWATIRNAALLQIKGRAKALQTLALAILQIKPQPKYTDCDLRLMRRLASRALDDLLARIEGSIGIAGASAYTHPANSNFYSLLIGAVGGAQLAIECAEAHLVHMVRSTYPRAASYPPLIAVDQSYNEQILRVAAHLGKASITVEQLAELEVGDTLVLDLSSNSAASLLVEDRIADLPVSLAEKGSRITLELQDAQ